MQELYYISGNTEEFCFPAFTFDDQIHIRWLTRDDLDDVCKIETQSFEYPWLKEDFLRCLQKRNCVGLAAAFRGQTIGFTIYELMKHRVDLLNFAIHKNYRRRCFGTQLIARLVKKLVTSDRSRISVTVRERNLPAQLFFRSCCFRAESILYNYYETTNEDAYLMQFRVSARQRVQLALLEYRERLQKERNRESDTSEGFNGKTFPFSYYRNL